MSDPGNDADDDRPRDVWQWTRGGTLLPRIERLRAVAKAAREIDESSQYLPRHIADALAALQEGDE